jgi:hypothetical protein
MEQKDVRWFSRALTFGTRLYTIDDQAWGRKMMLTGVAVWFNGGQKVETMAAGQSEGPSPMPTHPHLPCTASHPKST